MLFCLVLYFTLSIQLLWSNLRHILSRILMPDTKVLQIRSQGQSGPWVMLRLYVDPKDLVKG